MSAPTAKLANLTLATGPGGKPLVNAAVVGEWEDAKAAYTGPKLSRRMWENDNYAGSEGLDHVFRITYDDEANPTGMINLGMAENTMLTKDYLEYYGKIFSQALRPNDFTYGTQSSASKRFHKAVADMWNENFSPLTPVDRDDIATAPGATGALDQLFNVLGDAGDAVLIAAPHYNGFDANMVVRSGARIVNVYGPPPEVAFSTQGAEIAAFESAMEDCKAKGINVRAVLLCSPQNPWGRTYSKEVLLDYALFAEKHDLHLISDEIYALSVWDNPKIANSPPFISMLSLDVEKETGKKFDKSRLHIVYSFSKDFGCNGFRLGVIISQHNPLVIRGLLHIGFVAKLGSIGDALISHLINDKPTFKALVAKNVQALRDSSEKMAAFCEKQGWKPVPVNSGHFMMVDASNLGLKDMDEEKDFGRHCVEFGVGVGLGQSYHASRPGWLRLTHTYAPDRLDLALSRLDKAVEAWRRRT
ncbi:hypothetical protein CspeluHIS016_0500810 [Cutaneotrichosporon spelunceum]|uniref:Aminotransferase class I/classII large domain-containing protein n=1 Tax=Cutaneotrichosporon spelunceum TaxID=1672016 RepID=A0AAD3TWD5_9TREE|nr:hypothetical protein CspeluHIS016_0500810 [Cutaneotrichosporon spelunceum]